MCPMQHHLTHPTTHINTLKPLYDISKTIFKTFEDEECILKYMHVFCYFSVKTYVVGTRRDGSFEHPKKNVYTDG